MRRVLLTEDDRELVVGSIGMTDELVIIFGLDIKVRFKNSEDFKLFIYRLHDEANTLGWIK
jgi:hypothetical protein